MVLPTGLVGVVQETHLVPVEDGRTGMMEIPEIGMIALTQEEGESLQFVG